ncbi:MAG TPA: glycosyltransferase family 9 protein [Opitutales bacterium]|nr:glycosyltransferase family 9 protein [Opitutales bacterium]
MSKAKILAIKFKYLGDVVRATPAFRALRDHFPDAELHVLVAEDAAPLLKNLPWIDQVWSLPRTRGKARLRESWPVLKALREQHFDRSVDFVGNDRGAIISRVIGAKERLGMRPVDEHSILRRFAYTRSVEESDPTHHHIARHLSLLGAWGVPFPAEPKMEIRPDPVLAADAEKIAPGHPVIFHLSTSQTKKEWFASNWVDLYHRAQAGGVTPVLSSGPSAREQALLAEVWGALPKAPTLPPGLDLNMFMAVLARARLLVSPDTGPLFMAAGLGTPTLGLFGPTLAACCAPLGPEHHYLQGGLCPCSGHWHVCHASSPCMAALTPGLVWEAIQKSLAESAPART